MSTLRARPRSAGSSANSPAGTSALLELGGKAPMIVHDDAYIYAAVNGAIFGAFANMGQICMSTERLIVHEKVADEFVAKLAAPADKLPADDPRGYVALGSLVSPEAAEKMDGIIRDAQDKGAKVSAPAGPEPVVLLPSPYSTTSGRHACL